MRDGRTAIALVALLAAASVPLHSTAAWAALTARASVSPRAVDDSANQMTFTFTISNTASSNSERIGSVEITAPGGDWTVVGCPLAPAEWAARVVDGARCVFDSPNGADDDIRRGNTVDDFQVRVEMHNVPAGARGTWSIGVRRNDSFQAGGEGSNAQAASPGALTVEVRDRPSPSPTPIPTPTLSPTPTPTPSSTPSSDSDRDSDPDPSPTPTPSPSPTQTVSPSSPSPSPTPQLAQPTVPDLIAAGDTGISDRDDLTRADPLFVGSAPRADEVLVFLDGRPIGANPVNTDDRYAFTLLNLSDGTHSVYVVARSASRVDSEPSDTTSFQIDRSSPAVSIGEPHPGASTDPSPSLSGNAGRDEGDLVVIRLTIYRGDGVDGAPVWNDTTFRMGDAWTAQVAAADRLIPGDHTLTAEQSDAAGNRAGALVSFQVVVPQPSPSATDTSTPTVTPIPSPTSSVSSSSPTPSPTPAPTTNASPSPSSSSGGGGGGGGGGQSDPNPDPQSTPRPNPTVAGQSGH